MLELALLFVGTLPLLIGLVALRQIKRSDDQGSDDQPPPPDPQPPKPVLPPAPGPRRFQRVRPKPALRTARRGPRVRTPQWPARVRS